MVALNDLKEYNLFEVDDYAVANKFLSEPDFELCLPEFLRKRTHIIADVNDCIKKCTQKYVIVLPNTGREAHGLYKKIGNDFRKKSIVKYMKNISIAFDILEGDKQHLPMHNYMPYNMVFDVKMDFTIKSRFVDTGCHALKSDESCYAGVVSHEGTHIAFTYDSLNMIDIMVDDIKNDYPTATCS